jgi:hypothetical protein
VAAEGQRVERTRRKPCSRAESEFLCPSGFKSRWSPHPLVLAASHACQTVDLWKLVRSADRFVGWSCESPSYHPYLDGQRPHATAQDGLESAPIHPISQPRYRSTSLTARRSIILRAGGTLVGYRGLHAEQRARLHLIPRSSLGSRQPRNGRDGGSSFPWRSDKPFSWSTASRGRRSARIRFLSRALVTALCQSNSPRGLRGHE